MSLRWLAGSAAAACLLLGGYALAGGLDYRPAATPDPCQPRVWQPADGVTEIAEQVALSALDGAACELGSSREELGLAFTSRDRLSEYQEQNGFSDAEIENAAREGLLRAVDDGVRSGEIGGVEAFALRLAARAVPIDRLIELVRDVLVATG